MEKTILEKYEVTDLDEVIIDIPLKNTSEIHENINPELSDNIIESIEEIGENNFILRLTLRN